MTYTYVLHRESKVGTIQEQPSSKYVLVYFWQVSELKIKLIHTKFIATKLGLITLLFQSFLFLEMNKFWEYQDSSFIAVICL